VDDLRVTRLWRLEREGRRFEAYLREHPQGVELCAELDGQRLRSQWFVSDLIDMELKATLDARRRSLEALGWSAISTSDAG
jgi:hypothetical protein